jgi:hypothetical protein
MRSVRNERVLWGGTLTAILVTTTVLLAQSQPQSPPRGARPSRGAVSKPRGAPAPADNPYEDKPSAAPAQPVAPQPVGAPPPSDAGGAPLAASPPSAGQAAEGSKLSPLNPAPAEFSDAGPPGASIDYDRLLADIAALRARVAAVGDTLFHSRIAVSLETSGDRARIASLGVSIDDGVVWTSPASFRADQPTVVYEHAVAPGSHAVTIDVERRDARSDVFRSTQRSRFVVEVPADERLSFQVTLSDDSDMGDFSTKKKGGYELSVRARARSEPASADSAKSEAHRR